MMRYLISFIALWMLVWQAPAHAQEWTPDIEAWNSPEPPQWDAVIIRNVTVWPATNGEVLNQADVLIRRGKIAAVGNDLRAPRDALEIDGTGHHLTPGIIDNHSHAAIIGGVNEASRISTADVRIRDVIDSESINIYRQLAGGVTTINLLHGSANAIGGQMATIKMRWGAKPSDLVFDGARPGIKFALGENPKQSNWRPSEPRYPQTRPGVEQVIREKFQMASDYRSAMQNQPSGRQARNQVPPRPDHEMEAIVEIIEGRRDVHSHAYRADEMLALMRTAESFGFRIKTIQHVLEGYKVAPQMAAHGAGGSTFIDWWNFKAEATDAIGYNPALMHASGVLTALHSDNPELARRMNLDAAKAVRYGGVDEHEALKMITAYSADQIGAGDRIGRIAEGYDADVVLWDGHPLSAFSKVTQTWVDGRRYFDREADRRMQEALEAERAELIAMVLNDGKADASDATEEASEPNPERRQTFNFARHLTGYRPSELDHDEYCIFHAN